MRLILASSSPRRREILKLLGIPFDIINPQLDETPDSKRSVSEEASYWALRKSQAVASRQAEAIVIGSDTLIDFNGETIGKPHSPEEALEILQRLSGQTHRVVTAIAVLSPNRPVQCAIEKTSIKMIKASGQALIRYAKMEEPLDKAGAYSLQGEGRSLIEALEGDYLAAVGLPLRLLARFLASEPLVIPNDVEEIYKKKDFLNWKSY